MRQRVVVVGVRDAQASAVRFAASEATARGAGLRVVHCIESLGAPNPLAPHQLDPCQDVLDVAKQVVDAMPDAPRTDYALVPERPYDALIDESDANALMIVVGTDPATWMERVFSGRVAERLVKHASVPVAVVPEGWYPAASDAGVFVAVDAQTPAEGPLRFAFTEAQRRDQHLHVVHVAPLGTRIKATELILAELSQLMSGWRARFPDVTVNHAVVFDDIGEGCLRASADADLLVLGRFDGKPFEHPVLTQIARRVHCPCVVVPHEWVGGNLMQTVLMPVGSRT